MLMIEEVKSNINKILIWMKRSVCLQLLFLHFKVLGKSISINNQINRAYKCIYA